FFRSRLQAACALRRFRLALAAAGRFALDEPKSFEGIAARLGFGFKVTQVFSGAGRAHHRRREIGFWSQMQGDCNAFLGRRFDAVDALRLDLSKLWEFGERLR